MSRDLEYDGHFVCVGLEQGSLHFAFSPNFKRFKDFEQGEITNSLHPQKREVRQNDPGNELEGDIFAQTAPIPQWRALDQTLMLLMSLIVDIYLSIVEKLYISTCQGISHNHCHVEILPPEMRTYALHQEMTVSSHPGVL